MIIGVGLSGSNLFLYCYYGHLATDNSSGIADVIFETNWYIHLLEMQKYLILMIQNAQRPFYYHGFGMARLSLGTYTQV